MLAGWVSKRSEVPGRPGEQATELQHKRHYERGGVPARMPMAVEAAFHAGQCALPVGLHRSVRVRRALWVAAELTRPRLRRRWLGGLFFFLARAAGDRPMRLAPQGARAPSLAGGADAAVEFVRAVPQHHLRAGAMRG